MAVLEVCVDSLASARAAIAGGATRLELCSALAAGGLTPWIGLLEQIRRESGIPVRCLMRPRPGDFLYTEDEIQLMAGQIPGLKDAGADGFVIGCLTPDGRLDGNAMAPLLAAAAGSGLTLHRCADVSRDLAETCREAKRLGFDTVLTSGGAASCTLGADTIGRLLEEPEVPQILIGAGVSAPVIRRFRSRFPRAEAFHMSGKILLDSGMRFRREGVPMGLPGLDEWHIQQTGREAVALAAKELF